MTRLIDVSSRTALPPAIILRVGDLLLVRATGGSVIAGDAVELVGSFRAAALTPDGDVLAAMGGPDAVAFKARAVGQARIEVVKGDPWAVPRQATATTITVTP